MNSTTLTERSMDNFPDSYQEFMEATSLTKADKAGKLVSQVNALSLTSEGLDYLYEKIGEMEGAGIFKDTPWHEPDRLVPTLVKGTLKAGHPNSAIELLSELR